MNWISIGINVGATGIMLVVIGFFIRRWMERVDKKLDGMDRRMHGVELKLAALPHEFVLRKEYTEQKGHDSDKRENIWKEQRKMDRRLTTVEAVTKTRNIREEENG